MQKDSLTWTGATNLISLNVEEKLYCAVLIQTFFCSGKRQSKDGISAHFNAVKVSKLITFPWKLCLHKLLIEKQLSSKIDKQKPLLENLYAK